MRRRPAPIWRQTSTLAILQGRTHVYQFDRSQDRLSLHRACTLRINHDTLVERENSMARMKVLLLEDVPSLGLAGEVIATFVWRIRTAVDREIRFFDNAS